MAKKRNRNKKQNQKKATQNLSSHNKDIEREVKNTIENGLGEAILGNGRFGGQQVSDADTLYKSSRWYLISNMRQLLSQLYVENGLIKTVVNVPVDDALGGGIEIKSDLITPEELSFLEDKMEQEGDLQTAGQAAKWARLYGGGGLLAVTEEKSIEELDMAKIQKGSTLGFKAVDMWELYNLNMNVMDDPDDTSKLKSENNLFNYYSMKVHPSRVLLVKGEQAPSLIRPRLRGWGLSIVESLVRSINQYFKAQSLSFEVLDEFKVDVYKIHELANTLIQPNGEQKIHKRVEIANREKNFHHAITMDANDDYIQKQLSFAGLADVMNGLRVQVAADLRMPLTKLFGMSASGFNSGEDDIENYNAMVESDIRAKIKFHLLKMVKLRCQQLFGYIPEDLSINFPSLRIMSSDQEETVKTQKFNRLLQAAQAGYISQEQFQQACNQAELLPIQVKTESKSLLDDNKDNDNKES